MINYRLLALDLDGTLLTEDDQVSKETVAWVQRAVDTGVTVIFATGRGLQRVQNASEQLKLSQSPMVLLNGAEIWKCHDQLLNRYFIHRDDISELHRLAVSGQYGFWGYTVDGIIWNKDWRDEMLHWDWMKFGIRHEEADKIIQFQHQIANLKGLEVVPGGTKTLEISLAGRTKASGVAEICGLIGIHMSQVMAIGDSPNDIALLQAAGLGVAMDNAADTVKMVANVITSSNNQDGVAEAIQKYLF